MSSSNSPCAACKFLRRKCTQECIFAPYFPPDNPQRFAYVHRVFGASNVGKLLNELTASQREEAVKSLAYEADARLRDPVYGCVGFISILQQRLRQTQTDLLNAKKELAAYISPQAMEGPFPPHGLHGVPIYPPGKPLSSALLYPPFGGNVGQPLMVAVDPQQQELLEAQQLAAAAAATAAREQQQAMMMRTYEQQQECLRYNNAGFEPAGDPVSVAVAGSGGGGGDGGFGQTGAALGGQGEMTPCLAFGTFDSVGAYQMQQPQHGGEHYVGHATHHYPIEAQLLLPYQQQAQLSHQQQPSESEDCRSVGPSC